MADLTPNQDLAKKRKLLEIKEHKINIDRMEFRILELLDEIERMKTNINSTQKTIAELEKE